MSEDDNSPPNISAMRKHPAPASTLLGLHIESYDVAAGMVKVAFEAAPVLLNKLGSIQGGMVAAMLDETMTLAVGLSLQWGEITPTLEFKVSFLQAAHPGRLLGTGRVVRRGKSIAFLEGELSNEAGDLLATGSATVAIGHMKSPAASARPKA